MCLTNIKGPFVATRDIVCYKHLVEYKNKKLLTSYRQFTVEIGKTYNSDVIVDVFNSIYYEQYTEINVGLHSFFSVETAVKDIGNLSSALSFVIVKCIIPKGSTYYRGKFDKLAARASDKLKYVEIIERLP